ncbi:hypothetical protein BDW71DRAFT_211565 [Aspergillus fruticulosus]
MEGFRDEYRKLRSLFHRGISFSKQDCAAYPPVEKAVLDYFPTTYAFAPAEVQQVIATYTAFAILIDDSTNPNLLPRDMLRFIGDIVPRFYGPFASDMIRKAMIEFISACAIENRVRGQDYPRIDCAGLPVLLETQDRHGRSMRVLCFPRGLFPESVFLPAYLPIIPDLVRYVNLANDLLSFYKESVVGRERFNYI